MAWTPPMETIVTSYYQGAAGTNMGDNADEDSIPRIGMESSHWVPVYFRFHFQGGSGTADCNLVLDSKRGVDWNAILYVLGALGTGSDAFFGINEGQFERWVIHPGDFIVPEWTSAHASMEWALEVAIAPVPLGAF